MFLELEKQHSLFLRTELDIYESDLFYDVWIFYTLILYLLALSWAEI